MAEQVNQRIENMINELEQMRRTNLYTDEEIKEISQKRKEFEYHIQRRVKQKEDYVQYIAYELALLEDITTRRKKIQLTEKKKDLEYAIAQRLNQLFKRFIYKFQNEIEIYFEYIKFCKGVGFQQAISGIIGQMLQIHGDKPQMWLMASKWESLEQNNLENAKAFLLKGIQRNPDAEPLYLELFNIELIDLCFKAETDEEKEKLQKKADIIWRNGAKNIQNVKFLFKLYDLCTKYEYTGLLVDDIKLEIWLNRNNQEVWPYLASKELEGFHWKEIEEFADDEHNFPKVVGYVIGIYEEALQLFMDENLCTRFIHDLLGMSEDICSDQQKIKAVKHAWMYGHDNGLLSNDMYVFGIEMLKLENETTTDELLEILNAAIKRNPKLKSVWEQLLLHKKDDEKQLLVILQNATKSLNTGDALQLYNILLDNIESGPMIKTLYKKFQNCDNAILLAVKPKLLQKMYEHNGLKAARELYEDFIRTPPTQIELHKIMINIEKSQEKLNLKAIRKCYECAVHHHGTDNKEIWADYINFEIENGNAPNSAVVYRRAVGMLKKDIVDEFIRDQTLSKIK
ncbi:U3 small nucleolar RNA-associated protein 6 homolog [Bombyx mandarina]|uniref:U3 small nucleolar RNA-associated protein 6 homolog n=1 Tax=Bombyx mandarina TaxID=7092 RepID=A0A6J2JMJ9_BOMMA|nr:U3 small nucleolar RNA-associated protein 6 homolog [Bombyx mandarina]